VGGWEKIKLPQKKKNWEGGREKIKLQRKTKKRAENGQRKKQVNLGWHKDRKESPINAPSIHVGALGGCWFTLAHILLYYIIYKIVNST